MDRQSTKPSSAMFVAGLITGGVIATLYTPKSGRETREEIKHKANRAQEEVKHTADDMRDKFKRGIQEVKSSSRDQPMSDLDRE